MTEQRNKDQQTKEISKEEQEGISIMTDVDLHPLPITPNDPLSIFSNKMKFGSMDIRK